VCITGYYGNWMLLVADVADDDNDDDDDGRI